MITGSLLAVAREGPLLLLLLLFLLLDISLALRSERVALAAAVAAEHAAALLHLRLNPSAAVAAELPRRHFLALFHLDLLPARRPCERRTIGRALDSLLANLGAFLMHLLARFLRLLMLLVRLLAVRPVAGTGDRGRCNRARQQ